MTRANWGRLAALGVIALSAVLPEPLEARVNRIVVEAVARAPAVAGAEPYEIVTGRFQGELDPAAPGNMLITDIAYAPRNARGMVEYSATFAIARPLDPARSSGVLFYDVPNRGNGGVVADPHGHVRVISGWQGDLPEGLGLQTLRAPVARLSNGKPLTGPVLARFVDMPAGTNTLPIVGSIGLPTALAPPLSLDTRNARLLVQDRPGGSLHRLPANQWAFADCTQTAFPGKPDPAKLCLRGGFDPARAYSLVYTGKNPLVLGIGFAATRDLVAFLRHARTDDAGTPNPARNVRWAVASGTSQSGNYLKSFVHLGFNADEDGRIVFDGINANIAARQVPLNIRFAVPGGAARPGEAGSEGTLWWARYNDSARGLGTSSLLDRCTRSGTCPKVIETFGSAELWGLRMSPGLVGTRADRDIPVPEGVRRYYFPSVTHGGSWTGGFPLKGETVPSGCVLPGNPNPMMPELITLRQRLVEWVSNGTAPPPSSYPLLANGELVRAEAQAMGWPAIPGAPSPDGKLNRMVSQGFGTSFKRNDMSGTLQFLPPKLGTEIPLLVPGVDADGNETIGVRSVQLMVPLGTYLGWNVVAAGFDKGSGCGFAGGFIPFATTRAERLAAHDPRPSLEERYGSHEGFVAKVRDAAQRHSAAGWISADDAERLVAQAEASQVLQAKDQ